MRKQSLAACVWRNHAVVVQLICNRFSVACATTAKKNAFRMNLKPRVKMRMNERSNEPFFYACSRINARVRPQSDRFLLSSHTKKSERDRSFLFYGRNRMHPIYSNSGNWFSHDSIDRPRFNSHFINVKQKKQVFEKMSKFLFFFSIRPILILCTVWDRWFFFVVFPLSSGVAWCKCREVFPFVELSIKLKTVPLSHDIKLVVR